MSGLAARQQDLRWPFENSSAVDRINQVGQKAQGPPRKQHVWIFTLLGLLKVQYAD